MIQTARRTSRWHGLAVLLLVGASGWIGSSAGAGWRLTRRPRAPFVETMPSGLKHTRDVRIETSDGEELGAWFVDGEPDATCFLLLHGNGSARRHWSGYLSSFERAGMCALMPSLRSHGDSSGTVNDFGWSSRLDVIACVQWLLQRERPRRLVIAGFSTGAVAAIHAAPELDAVSAYYLESPYPSIDTAMQRRLDKYLPPLFDTVAATGLRISSRLFLTHDPELHSPLASLERMPEGPAIRLLAFESDELSPPADARSMAATLSRRAEVHILPGAGHRPYSARDPEGFFSLLTELGR